MTFTYQQFIDGAWQPAARVRQARIRTVVKIVLERMA